MVTTIQLSECVKEQLASFKIHKRETYNDLLQRMILGNTPKIDTESLLATIEILSDPTAMREIREALKHENGTSLEEFEKELGF